MDSQGGPVLPRTQMGRQLNCMNGQASEDVPPHTGNGPSYLRLPNSDILASQALSSPMQFQQSRKLLNGDPSCDFMSRPSGAMSHMHTADHRSVTSNADLLTALNTMTSQQQHAMQVLTSFAPKLQSNSGVSQMHSVRRYSHSVTTLEQQAVATSLSQPAALLDVPPPPSNGLVLQSMDVRSVHTGEAQDSAGLPPQNLSRETMMHNSPHHRSHEYSVHGTGQLELKATDGPCTRTQLCGAGHAVGHSADGHMEQLRGIDGYNLSSVPAGAICEDASPSPPSKRQRSSEDAPKNQNRNMSGVPEWSRAEMDAVMRLYDERGRLPKWKPIADDLARLNISGELNSNLLHKGLVRSNNAVMNKVKEILFKAHGDVSQRSDGSEAAPKRNTSGVPEWNEAEINTVLEIWNKHGRQSEWKSISLELADLNTSGQLNPELTAKGLQRTNNAVMNKVKELSGIARARRSRPRTIGNFALLPFEMPKQGREPLAAASQSFHGSELPNSASGVIKREEGESVALESESGGTSCHCVAMEAPMGVVSPLPLPCPPPVVLQTDAKPQPPVPHVSPVAFVGTSPVIQQNGSHSS